MSFSRVGEICRANGWGASARPQVGSIARKVTGGRVERKSEQSFLTYDGESTTSTYTLLGNDREYIYNREGLSTRACLDFLTRDYDDRPIRCFFGLTFDVNHIVRDLKPRQLADFFSGKVVVYGRYTLEYLAGHILYVGLPGRRWTYSDTRGYFTGNLLDAARGFGLEVGDVLVQGKAARSDFSAWSEQELRHYHAAECATHSELMERVRQSLTFGGSGGIPSIRPSYWHGPGAVASTVLGASGIGPLRKAWESTSATVRDALSRAYYGGRSEQLRLGTVSPIYAYDLRSAYPWAMTHLRAFSSSWWTEADWKWTNAWSVHHVAWDVEADGRPGPLPWRTSNGYITYPSHGAGWYWRAEVDAAMAMFGASRFRVDQSYQMADTIESPLVAIIQALYAKRRAYRASGDPREGGIKLALNALYGKFCQGRGRSPYFNLGWAGFITSLVRAKLLRAAMQAPASVVAFNTDSIVTDVPLNLPIGEELGQWEERQAESGLFLQPGLYRLDGHSPKHVRGGFKLASFPWMAVLSELRSKGSATVSVSLFVTQMLAKRRAFKPHKLTILEPGHPSGLNVKTIEPFESIKRDLDLPAKAHRFDLSGVHFLSTMPRTLPFEPNPYETAESHLPDVFASDSDDVFEEAIDAAD